MKTIANALRTAIVIGGTIGLFSMTLWRWGVVESVSWGLYLDVTLAWASVVVIVAGLSIAWKTAGRRQ